MSIIQCPHGHFYDDEKYSTCPSCMKPTGFRWQLDRQKTVSLDSMEAQEEVTVRLTAETPEKQSYIAGWDSEKTVALSGTEESLFLSGWLVCIQGPMKGKDYRLYPGFNRIGRSLASDICLQDPQVSNTHCSVVYDQKSRRFFLVPGKGTAVYMENKLIQNAVELQEGSRFSLGSSTLELIPFCKGDHVWETL